MYKNKVKVLRVSPDTHEKAVIISDATGEKLYGVIERLLAKPIETELAKLKRKGMIRG